MRELPWDHYWFPCEIASSWPQGCYDWGWDKEVFWFGLPLPSNRSHAVTNLVQVPKITQNSDMIDGIWCSEHHPHPPVPLANLQIYHMHSWVARGIPYGTQHEWFLGTLICLWAVCIFVCKRATPCVFGVKTTTGTKAATGWRQRMQRQQWQQWQQRRRRHPQWTTWVDWQNSCPAWRRRAPYDSLPWPMSRRGRPQHLRHWQSEEEEVTNCSVVLEEFDFRTCPYSNASVNRAGTPNLSSK